MLTEIQFLAPLPLYDEEKPYSTFPLASTNEKPTSNVELISKSVEILNLRNTSTTLFTNGFQVERHDTNCLKFVTVEDAERYKAETSSFLQTIIPHSVHVTTYDFVVRENRAYV